MPWNESGAITAEEMAKVDRKAAEFGIPQSLLMENAGCAIARTTAEKFGTKLRVVIFAGTGNNGGDGFVAARRLLGMGAKVDVFLIGSPGDIRTEEARFNWEAIQEMKQGIEIHTIGSVADLDLASRSLKNAGAIVDAMLGTGVSGPLREPFASAVRMINESGAPVVAADAPTGVDPTTGEVHGDAVRADCTVTFHRMKTGFPKAKEYTGDVMVADIEIPPEAEALTIGERPPARWDTIRAPDRSERLVSACLLGVNCRYDGKNNLKRSVVGLADGEVLIPVCPEQLGGLGTPREPMEIVGGAGAGVLDGKARVENASGGDVTDNMVRGADKTLKIAKSMGVSEAIMKSRSPSCGNGVAAALLERNGVRVITEDELPFG